MPKMPKKLRKMLEICLIASGTRTRVPQQNGCHLHWQSVVANRGLGVVGGGVYLRYPLVYARHRQLTLVLEGVFDELGVGERRFLRPACFAVVGSHVPRGGGKQLDGSGGVEGGPHRLAAHKVYATAAGSSRWERERERREEEKKKLSQKPT